MSKRRPLPTFPVDELRAELQATLEYCQKKLQGVDLGDWAEQRTIVNDMADYWVAKRYEFERLGMPKEVQ